MTHQQQQQHFALDTVHFIGRNTTDSDPFGDRDQVGSIRSQQPLQQQNPFTVTYNNEQLRREAQQILEQQSTVTTTPLPPVFTDTQLLINVKRQMLEGNPTHLINILLFWIEFQVSRGMPNHNQCILNVLQDMKNLFVARNMPMQQIVQQLNNVLCSVVQNLNNDDYDGTESIVEFVQIVGAYFMKTYLIERQVVLENLESFDLLTTWVYFQYIMKRQTPPNLDSNDALLNCMRVFEEKTVLPVL